MIRILVVALFALGLFIGIVLAVPGMIDWSRFAPDIAARLSVATGQDVTIGGTLDLKLVPQPTLTIGKIEMTADPADTLDAQLNIERLDARVAFWPLLAGHIQIEKMTLIRPELILTQAEKNADTDPALSATESLMTRLRNIAGHFPSLRFDSVQVEDGIFRLNTTALPSLDIDRLGFRLTAYGPVGPFRLDGHGRIDELTIDFVIDTSQGTTRDIRPLRVRFDIPDMSARGRFSGLMSFKDGPVLTGDLRMSGERLEDVIGTSGLPTPLAALMRASFALDSSVLLTRDRTEMQDVTLTVGDVSMKGKIGFARNDEPAARPRVDVQMHMVRIDLDRTEEETGKPSLLDRLLRSSGNTDSLALPGRIDLNLDIGIGTLLWRGRTIRRLSFKGVWADGSLSVRELNADLPGGTAVKLSGMIGGDPAAPLIDAVVSANSNDLRGALSWLGATLPETLPGDRLRGATFSARIAGRLDKLDLTDIQAQIDQTRLTGAIALADRGREGYGIRLHADRLNLDTYLPTSDTSSVLKDWLTSDTLVEQVLPQMAGVDANIDLAIDTLTLCGVAVNGLTLDTTLDDGSMELRRLTLDTSLGARLEAKGRIDRLSLLTGMDLSYSIVSTDWDRLIRAVAGAMLLSPERTGLLNKMAKTVVVSGRMTGSSDKTGIEMTVDLGESGRLEIGGDMTVAAGPNSFDMTARLTHPETSALMTLFGMDVPTAFEDAPADLFARIEGTRQNFVFKDLQGGIGDLTVMGSVSVDRSPARPVVVIDLTTGILDVPGLWPEHENDNEVSVVRWPDTSFCSNWLSRFDGNFKLEAARLDWPPLSLETARLNAGLKDGVLVVRSLSGKLAGGEVNLDGRFDSRGPLPKGVAKLCITGGHLDKLGAGPLAVIEGAVDLDLNLQAEGDSTAAMIRHLSGSGQISARGGHLAGFDVGAVVAALAQAEVPGDFVDRASVSMQQGRTPFRSLDASLRFDGGLARTEDLKIVSDVVTATARGVVDLPGWTLDILTVFKLAGSQPPPPFSMRLTGYVDAPEKDFDFAGLREHLVGRAAKALIKSLVDQKDGTTAPSPPQPPKPDHKAAIQGVLERILDSNEGLP